jgi:hypothetical protein
MTRFKTSLSFFAAATVCILASPATGFGFSFQSGAFRGPRSMMQSSNQENIISVYEGDRTALQLTTVPEMRRSVFKDSGADNGRDDDLASSAAGLPEGLFKLTDPERINKLEQLAGSPLTYKRLRSAFAESLTINPDQAISTAASALFLARTLDASPKEMVKLLRTGILILSAKGTRYLPQASALVGFAVQVSSPEEHQWIVSSLRMVMIGALPENMPDEILIDGTYNYSRDNVSQESSRESDWGNFANTRSADMALVNAGILEPVGMNDWMWGEMLTRMGNNLMASRDGPPLADGFDLMGLGSGPLIFNQNSFYQEVSQPAIVPDAPPAPTPAPTPLVFPTPPPPYG